mgnify:CR=1 FL=1
MVELLVGGTMSYAVEVKTAGDKTWVGNGLRYESRELATTCGSDLAARWMAILEWQVVESTDPVNTDSSGNYLSAKERKAAL